MLATTVSYLSLLESKRHNQVSEKQQDTQLGINQQLANIQAGNLEETKRHNVAMESFNWDSLAETKRHNQVVEGINEFDATTRRQQLDINRYDAETRRYSAVQSAGIGWANVAVNQGQLEVSKTRASNDYDIGLRNAESNRKQAEIASKRQEEEVRWHDITAMQTQESIGLRQNEFDWNKEIQQKQYELNKTNILWGRTLDTVDTASELFHNLASDISDARDSLRPDSVFIKKRRKKGK